MAVTFLEPCGDTDFAVKTIANLGFWGYVYTTAPAIATDYVRGTHQKSIRVAPGGASSTFVRTPNGVVSDTGGRFSVYVYLVALPTNSKVDIMSVTTSGGSTSVVRLYLTSGGVLQLWRGAGTAQIGSDGSTLQTGRWYRISLAYTISSSTVNEFRVFVDGTLDITTSNNSSITTSSSVVSLGRSGTDSVLDYRISDFYVDNSNSLSDTGNVGVTAKRPYSNGTAVEFTTQIGSGNSGYGSGHADEVNERPLSTTNGWSRSTTTKRTEEYSIESVGTGDINLTGATIIDYMGWICAGVDSTSNSPVHHIIVGGTATAKTMTTSPAMYTQFAGSSTYPAGNTDIGMDAQYTTTAHLTSLYECGIVVAYLIPGSIKTIGGLTLANVKTIGGLAIASVKKIGGLA